MQLVNYMLDEDSDKIEIKKHSATVQIGNKIAAQQRKIYNVLLHIGKEALTHNPKTDLFSMKQIDLKRLCGDSSTNNKQLQENLKGLMSTIVEFNILKKDNKTKWHATTLLSEASIDEGRINFAFAPTVKKTLLHPEYYVLLDLNIIKGLNSKYSIALYENARDFFDKGFPKMEITLFRKLMGVNDNKYKNFADFKKRVIDPSIEEINQKTDMIIKYELFKEGRRFTHIKFSMQNQEFPTEAILEAQLL